MTRVRIDKAEKILTAIVDKVCSTHKPVILTNSKGDVAKIVPVPKPIGSRRGRLIYRLEDMQFLEIPPY